MSRVSKMRQRSRKSLKVTVQQMVPAVLTALVATVLGFIALYTSPVPMIQDFGKMLSLGMVVSFIVGIFILIPLLFVRDGFFREGIDNEGDEGSDARTTTDSRNESKLRSSSKTDRLLERWTNAVMKFKWLILVLAIGLAIVGIVVDLDAPAETDVETFMPQDSEVLSDIKYLRDVLGSTDQVSLVYESDNVLDEKTLKWVEALSDKIVSEFPEAVVSIQSLPALLKMMDTTEGVAAESLIERIPNDQRDRFVNVSRTKGVVHIGIGKLSTDDLAVFIEELEEFVEEERIGSVETTLTGQSVLDLEMVSALTSGRYQMTLLGMAFVFLGLFAFYRRLDKALIPLLPIILIIGWSGLAVYGLGIEYTPLTATLGALIIGIGTEFTILLMERYYEERQGGASNRTAITIANQKVGKAIFASALTTIGGFSALLFSDFAILSNFGMMTLINIALALVSTVVVMPALLMVVGGWITVKRKKQELV